MSGTQLWARIWARIWAGAVSLRPYARYWLTALRAQNLKRPGYHCDGGGLYLRVTLSGTKSWLFRFTFAGRTRDMGLGSFPTVSLAAARDAAQKCREQLVAGADPIEGRAARRRAARLAAAELMTFKKCAEAYIASHEAAWINPKHRAQWRSTLARYVYPVIGGMPIQNIDTPLVLKVVEPLWKEPVVKIRHFHRRAAVVGSGGCNARVGAL